MSQDNLVLVIVLSEAVLVIEWAAESGSRVGKVPPNSVEEPGKESLSLLRSESSMADPRNNLPDYEHDYDYEHGKR